MTKEKKETRCDDLIDALLKEHGISQQAVLGENGLIAQLKKRVVERKPLAGELTHHLGNAKGDAPEELDNHCNGYSKKTVVGEDGAMEIEVPRSGSFEPLLIAKGQKRFEGFDEKIIAMYARGMMVREIAGFLLDHSKVEVNADFISTVTHSVLEAVVEWQNRPLERSYPVIYFEALRMKIRDEGSVRNKAVYLALGIASDGTKDVLGIWIEQNEGAKFWLKVMNELRNRGVEDILIAVVDGLKGFPEPITTAFPLAGVQTCIVHLSRYCLSFCGWKERQPVARELKAIYRAETAEGCRQAAGGVRRRPLGPKVSDDCRELAPKLGTDHSLLQLSAGGAKDHLHHQCDRKFAYAVAQSAQESGALPERRSGQQAYLSGLAKHHQIVDKSTADLEDGGQPIGHPIWAEI